MSRKVTVMNEVNCGKSKHFALGLGISFGAAFLGIFLS